MKHVFGVYDSQGFWGEVRAEGRDENEAQAAAARYLEENDVQPVGSLEADFTLDFKRLDDSALGSYKLECNVLPTSR